MRLEAGLEVKVIEPTQTSLGSFLRMLSKMWENLARLINGNVTFGDGTNIDNINGSWINVTAPATPNTDFVVNHNLGRLPSGYLIMEKDRACDVYTGSAAPTKTQITLRVTVASAVLRMFILALTLAFLTPTIWGQGTPFHDIATYNSGVAIRAIPNASVSVCTGTVVSTSCVPTVLIYSDVGLTQKLPNPTQADVNGNFSFYTTPGAYIIVISGAGVQPYAYPVSIPNLPGSFSGILPNAPLACNASLSIPATGLVSYEMQQNCAVTSSVVTGSPVNGNILSLTIIENAPGGFPFSFPPNFIFDPSFVYNTASGAVNNFTMKFDGTFWYQLNNTNNGGGVSWYTVATLPTGVAVNTTAGVTDGNGASCSSGGGTTQVICRWNGSIWVVVSSSVTGTGCTASGQVNDIQKNNGAGCSPSSINDNGTTTRIGTDLFPFGPNPYADGRRFNIRVININQWPTGTGSCVATNTTLNFTSLTFTLFNLDGLFLFGCGPANPGGMTTPSITVTPVHNVDALNTGHVVPDTSGGTTYTFSMSNRDPGWGMTAASATVSTTQGPATLGALSVTGVTVTRSGNINTYTGVGFGFNATSLVTITGFPDGTFNGGCNVISATSTTFTCAMGTYTQAGGATSSAGTGTVSWDNGIQICPTNTNPTGALQGIVYETAPIAQVLGPTNLYGLENGYNDASYGCYNYWGQTINAPPFNLPSFVPTTPPASPINDALVTTIASGCAAGCLTSGSLTLATAPSNTVSGTMRFDNGPNLLTAKASFPSTGGYLYLPIQDNTVLNATYVTQSFVDMGNTTILFGDPAVFGDTFKSSGHLLGAENPLRCSNPSFAQDCRLSISGNTSYPSIWSNGATLSNLTVGVPQNGIGILETGHYKTQNRVNYVSGENSDYLGILLLVWGDSGGSFGGHFSDISIITGPNPQVSWNATSCAVWFKNDTNIVIDKVSGGRRGFCFQQADFGLNGQLNNFYQQGPILPSISFISTRPGSPVVTFALRQFQPDTSGVSSVGLFSGSNGTPTVQLYVDTSTGPGAGQTMFTGKPLSAIYMNNFPNGVVTGQNVNICYGSGPSGLMIDGNFSNALTAFTGSPFTCNNNIVLGPAFGVYTTLVPPAAISPTVIAGGTLTVGLHNINYYPVYINGSSAGFAEGTKSITSSFTTTTGNQAITIPNPNIPGAAGYDFDVDGFSANVVTCGAVPQVAATATFPITYNGGTCGNSSRNVPGGGPASMEGNAITAYNFYDLRITPTGVPSPNAICANGPNGAFTTTGCNGGMVWPIGSGIPHHSNNNTSWDSVIPDVAALSGQNLCAVNGFPSAFCSPGVKDGNGAVHVTTTPYNVSCDNATTLTDRMTTIVFDAGSGVINTPDHTAAGCGANMSFRFINESGGSLTINRGGSDTFNITGLAGGPTIAATTTPFPNNLSFTLNNGEAGIWNLTAGSAAPAGAAGGDLTGTYPNPGVGQVNGAAIPLSALSIGTNASRQFVANPTTGTGNDVFSVSPTLTTPNLGTPSTLNLANATNLPCGAMPALTGDVTSTAGSCNTNVGKVNGASFPVSAAGLASNGSGQPIVGLSTTIITAATQSASGTTPSEYFFNENVTASTAVTLTLPAAVASFQKCISNANNGSAPNTGALTIQTSAAGQFIIFFDGTLTATGGFVSSSGLAADAACVVGVDSTHWMLYVQRGTWTKH